MLKNIFGTLTSGQVAVYGFFFISGFLVLDSAMRSSIYAFMSRRVLRIVPGFVAAYLISISLVFWLEVVTLMNYLRASGRLSFPKWRSC